MNAQPQQPNPYTHRATVMGRELVDGATGMPIRAHDEVLIDFSEGDYREFRDWGRRWVKVAQIAPGTAAVYPVKVRVRDGTQTLQFKAGEIIDVRRPRTVLMWDRHLREIGAEEHENDYTFGADLEAVEAMIQKNERRMYG